MGLVQVKEIQSFYENLILEEDELVAKVRLCEDCQWTLFQFFGQKGEAGRGISEEILTAIHIIEQDLRTELLHLRIEKSNLAGKMSGGLDASNLEEC